MTDVTRLEQSTIDHEEFREHPYLDTRKLWTFAIGRCLETNPLTAQEWKHLLDNGELTISITRNGATWLMRREHTACEQQCRNAFDFWPELNDARQNVLIELCYQMGIEKVKGFKNMIAAVRRGDFDAAAEHGMDSLWARQTPRRAQQLMRQMRIGEFPVLGGS